MHQFAMDSYVINNKVNLNICIFAGKEGQLGPQGPLGITGERGECWFYGNMLVKCYFPKQTSRHADTEHK